MAEFLLEEVARALLLTVKQNLNAAIDDVWGEMVAKDAAFYAAMGESVPVTPKVYPASYYLGHHPTILQHDVADYPNVTVVSYEEKSAGDLRADQYEVLADTGYVEVFVAHADESTINRLAWRYAKALHKVVSDHRTLGGEVEPIPLSPTVTISNSLARLVTEFSDESIYLQGCRLEYVFKTDTIWD